VIVGATVRDTLLHRALGAGPSSLGLAADAPDASPAPTAAMGGYH
jgi:hypothetical protein